MGVLRDSYTALYIDITFQTYTVQVILQTDSAPPCITAAGTYTYLPEINSEANRSTRPSRAALVRHCGGAIDTLQRTHRQLVQRTVDAPKDTQGCSLNTLYAGSQPGRVGPACWVAARARAVSAPSAIDVAVGKGKEATDRLEVDSGELPVGLQGPGLGMLGNSLQASAHAPTHADNHL